ncbi:hypothetical protein BCR43DRAFT_431096 [Syncephalastrum racemosum]|uniref:Uncharacterized protein n=1 Tax=Syncephalastrum racemosum TaxID=13706 RepID=A0A1X2HUH3_SYNRA|nr:hypothetical protein BCR43DRAFT_431096 [Syncephalastrum racemosum]
MSPSFVIISGGSACNAIAPAFQNITKDVCYILGISDNGGSTSELLRVLGGPSIGDLRARLTRLIPTTCRERQAIKELLSYRLSATDSESTARDTWVKIVEGRHPIWQGINIEKKEAIRGFLVLFNFEILKRAHKQFSFRNGSIGNFFLSGARQFLGSLEAAIFLFQAITGIEEPTAVVPVINTNHTAAIAAQLLNGDILRGQCEISHPGPSTTLARTINPIDALSRLALPNSPEAITSPEVRNGNLFFDTNNHTELSSPIRRIYYMNEYGQEIFPLPNPKVLHHLGERGDTLIYSIGSLYTSIVPCLILRGVGRAIANAKHLKHKILLLNGYNDRETTNFTAVDFIWAVTRALNQSQAIDARHTYYNDLLKQQASHEGYASNIGTPPALDIGSSLMDPTPPSGFITHVLYLTDSQIEVNVQAIESLNIECIPVEGDGAAKYDADKLQEVLQKTILKA